MIAEIQEFYNKWGRTPYNAHAKWISLNIFLDDNAPMSEIAYNSNSNDETSKTEIKKIIKRQKKEKKEKKDNKQQINVEKQ